MVVKTTFRTTTLRCNFYYCSEIKIFKVSNFYDQKRPSSNDPHCSNDSSERKQVKRIIRQYTDEIAIETAASQDLGGFRPGEVPNSK